MIVTVMERNRQGWPLGTKTVEIGNRCPVCGTKRGEAQPRSYCEDGEWYTVDVWENPCGHVDLYAAVLAEAHYLQQQKEPA